jgi:hypothetical protein
METTTAPGPIGEPAAPAVRFGPEQLFLSDTRLALHILNHLRYQALERLLGVPRGQANLVTAVLALTATEAAVETTRRIVRAPLPVSGGDAAAGAFLIRAAGLGLAGPGGRNIPGFGALVTFAVLGGLAAPGLRAGMHRLRTVEQRVRAQRIARYVSARRFSARDVPAT